MPDFKTVEDLQARVKFLEYCNREQLLRNCFRETIAQWNAKLQDTKVDWDWLSADCETLMCRVKEHLEKSM